MNRLTVIMICTVATVAMTGLCSFAQEPTTQASSAPGKMDFPAIAQKVLPSLAKVEWTVQYDKGEAPRADGWSTRCPNCGQYHGGDVEALVTQERPLEACGYILSPTKVLVSDPMIHPRFVSKIEVRYGQQLVAAKIASYCIEQNGLVLELEQPLKDAKPLEFSPTQGNLYGVTYNRLNGQWVLNAQAISRTYAAAEDKRQFATFPSNCLVVDAQGQPVTVVLREDLPSDESWMVSPEKWPMITAKELAQKLGAMEESCGQMLPRVSLSFRSPKKNANERSRYSSRDDDNSAQRNVLGLVLDENTIAVLCNLKRDQTARLEHIKVFPAKGEPITATFVQSMKDYGCFVAKLEKPLPGGVAVSAQPVTSLQCRLLLAADIEIKGENRIAYYKHARIAGCNVGWKGRVYPEIRGSSNSLVLFDAEGKLVAMPIVHRPKVGAEERYGSDNGVQTPVAYLASAVADVMANCDKANCPLTEEQENRLAWTGLVCQALDRELARANNVSEQTQDGQTGALVSYVYPDSPAAKAGIKTGYVLLRLHVSDQPKPIEVRLESDPYGGRTFPWDRLDQMPEAYYDQVPPPWPSAEDTLCRALTDIGFGKQCTAEFFYNGEVIKKDFVIEEGPAHFDSAPKFKSTELGLTVRDMTYELRRYFQKQSDDPGVIISKEEPGSKASVAGIKPFEIITHIDGEPVMNVKDFERLLGKQGEVKLSVSRMNKGRVVKIKMNSASKPASSTAPASSTSPASSTAPATE